MNEVEKITVDDAERILRKEYRQDVIGVVSAYADALGTDVTDAESAYTWLWETIDGHGRVIYTARAQMGLFFSDNDAAYGEEFGDEGIVTDGVINWSTLMFSAFRADVMEELERYELPVSDFDDIDIDADDAENAASELADVADDAEFGSVWALYRDASGNELAIDIRELDADLYRQDKLESIGARVNAELKSNGWFD